MMMVIMVLNDKDNDVNGDDESLVVFVGSHLSLGVAGQLSTWREPALTMKTEDLQHTISSPSLSHAQLNLDYRSIVAVSEISLLIINFISCHK